MISRASGDVASDVSRPTQPCPRSDRCCDRDLDAVCFDGASRVFAGERVVARAAVFDGGRCPPALLRALVALSALARPADLAPLRTVRLALESRSVAPPLLPALLPALLPPPLRPPRLGAFDEVPLGALAIAALQRLCQC